MVYGQTFQVRGLQNYLQTKQNKQKNKQRKEIRHMYRKKMNSFPGLFFKSFQYFFFFLDFLEKQLILQHFDKI